MKRFLFCSLGILALVLMFGSNSAMAAAFNVRPINLGSNSLQGILNNITVSGPGINAVNDQTPFALFTSQASGGAIATFIIQLAGGAASHKFGLYSADNSANQAQIFSGVGTAGDQAIVSFFANGDIHVNFVEVATGFSSTFGFYLTAFSTTFFSEDDKNANGDAQALIYQGDGATQIQIGPLQPGTFGVDEYIIAFEDLVFASSDKDFNDFVVLVESIEPIPEPSTLLLLGCGIVGFAVVARRKQKKS